MLTAALVFSCPSPALRADDAAGPEKLFTLAWQRCPLGSSEKVGCSTYLEHHHIHEKQMFMDCLYEPLQHPCHCNVKLKLADSQDMYQLWRHSA
jgi:hypothetical protein